MISLLVRIEVAGNLIPSLTNQAFTVYHCRSDTESIRTPDDITVSSTFMVNDSTTLAVMYGCTPGVMKRTKDWLKELKEPTFHPLTLPMIFAELERKRLLHAFSREDTEVSQRVLNMDSRKQGIGWGMEEMTQRDCDSTRLWLRISRLKVGLGSLKIQLESMIRHSRNLSDTVFTQAGGEHKTQRASGDRIVDRLEEMIAEIEGKNQACDGLLGGMTLAMQIVRIPIVLFNANFQVTKMAVLIRNTRSQIIIREGTQILTPALRNQILRWPGMRRETVIICRRCLSWG